jgi:HSP20 family protein
MLDPFDEIRRMHEEIDKMFYNAFRGPYGGQVTAPKDMVPDRGTRMPVADVCETESAVIANIELPGVKKEDIQLNVMDDHVEVKVEHNKESEVKEKGEYKYQRSTRQFYRRLPLPANVDASNAKAEYKNGMLKVEIPKLRIENKKKQIDIK